jgi:hypothetical protein
MKPDTPKPTPAEKKFDLAQEEAFSNEGAPPPAGEGSKGAAVARIRSLCSVGLPSRSC